MMFKCPMCDELHDVDSDGKVQCAASGLMLTLPEHAPTLIADGLPAGEVNVTVDVPAVATGAGSKGSSTNSGRHSTLHRLACHGAHEVSGVIELVCNKYSPIEDIASGGMGKVILARDNDLNRRVAMKTVLPSLSGSRRVLSRLFREAQTVGQLEHPNIVPLYDVDMNDNDELFFTMKYVQGRTLEEVINDLEAGVPEVHARFSWQRRAAIIQQVCDAMEFAHRKGVIHRDLKPANIMLGEFGEVIVMDWGLAKHVGEVDDGAAAPAVEASELRTDKTQAGVLIGTPAFMSPEQANGEPATTLSDIYAIGVIMYQLFGLRKPHTGDTLAGLLRAITDEPPPRVDSLKHPHQGAVPIEVHYILAQAMAKATNARHQTAAALKAHIQLFQDGRFPVVCPHTAMKRLVAGFARQIDNHPRGVAIALLALLMLVGVMLAASWA